MVWLSSMECPTEDTKGRTGSGGTPPRAQDGSLVCSENSRTVRDMRRNLVSKNKTKRNGRKAGQVLTETWGKETPPCTVVQKRKLVQSLAEP